MEFVNETIFISCTQWAEEDSFLESKLLLLLTANFADIHRNLQKDIYRDYYNLVYGIVFYIIKDHAATEDIVQESFMTVINKLPQLENELKLKAWIKVIVRNNTFNYLRKNKKNRNELELDSVFLYEETVSPTFTQPVEDEIEAKLLAECISKHLETLKPEYKIIIEMRWKHELSYKEIACELGTTEDIVRQKLHRAREAMKKKLSKEWW